MQRLLTTILVIISAVAARAQLVTVDGHYGLIDASTQRVLVCLTPEQLADAQLPATFTHEGRSYDVHTTTLPLIRLQHGALTSESFADGRLTLIDPEATADPADAAQGTVATWPAQLRYRGATALAYDKKNYAVKLCDPASEGTPEGLQPIDASLLGMRSDNSWILDAMASDVSRLRNRASTDFWLSFSAKPYYADLEPQMTNGTHGRYVEVFLDDRYWGLYCLTEKVDRKQLKLKKFKDGAPRGILYKSFTYDNLHQISDPNPSNDSFTWQGWECSYPDVRKGEPIDWTPLYDLITFLCLEVPDFDLIDHLHERVDRPLWRDYILFCDLLHADDNVSKNLLVYYRDITAPATILSAQGTPYEVPAPGPLCVCPWDLDATWGRSFDRQIIDPLSNCNVSNAVNYHLWVSQTDQGRHFLDRWAELRAHHFMPDHIWTFFQRYFDLFASSGAAGREAERWQDVNGVHLDFEAEARYMREWIERRVYYLDGDYEYANEGILAPTTPLLPSASYLLDGRRVDRPTRPGFYIVGGKKVIKK